MQVIRSLPPHYAKVIAAFPHVSRTRGIMFAWGDVVYALDGVVVTPSLMAHEEVHGQRQRAGGVEAWWDRYLADAQFRYDEELLAHIAEYAHLAQRNDRNKRRLYLDAVAAKLAGPLYGYMTTKERAKRLIKDSLAAIREKSASHAEVNP